MYPKILLELHTEFNNEQYKTKDLVTLFDNGNNNSLISYGEQLIQSSISRTLTNEENKVYLILFLYKLKNRN